MSEGTWFQGRVDLPVVGGTQPIDNFKRSVSFTAAGTAGIVISAKPGRFYRCTAENTGVTAYFLQVFDSATAPVNAAVPIYQERLPASGEAKIDLSDVNGWPCVTGISIAISSTAGVLTLAVAADLASRAVVYTSNT
jgi:hypothetical protein